MRIRLNAVFNLILLLRVILMQSDKPSSSHTTLPHLLTSTVVSKVMVKEILDRYEHAQVSDR